MNGSDGIGDTTDSLDSKNKDGYPLMSPIIPYSLGTGDIIDVSSNSTIKNISMDITNKELSFIVTGVSGTTGFCKVAILKSLLWCDNPDQWIVNPG